jgi:hypothetical protein
MSRENYDRSGVTLDRCDRTWSATILKALKNAPNL